MKLILIHGRDQQGQDALKLKASWITSLERGLKKNNMSLPPSTEVEIVFPFYADILDELVTKSKIPQALEGVILKGGNLDERELPFLNEVLADIAENAGITDAQIAKNYIGKYKEAGPLNWEWVQAILKAIDKHTPFGEFTIQRFTYDVYMYLTYPGIRRVIDDFVASKLDETPCVVVGHSLGSIVGYNVLRSNSNLKVRKYVTLGSPLGLKTIRTKLDVPISMPSCISGGWFNAYDDRDVVALNPLSREYFDFDPVIINKGDVVNKTDNRHGIDGYLDDAEVAKIIYMALLQ